MAYGNYFPQGYQPLYYQPQYQPPQVSQVQPAAQQPVPAQQSSGLIWVQGEAGAKSYLVAPNTTVLLMDSEGEQFFLKSADASGMPLPLRIFKYSETSKSTVREPEIAPPINVSEFVSKDEFEAFKSRTEAFMSKSAQAVKPHERREATK